MSRQSALSAIQSERVGSSRGAGTSFWSANAGLGTATVNVADIGLHPVGFDQPQIEWYAAEVEKLQISGCTPLVSTV